MAMAAADKIPNVADAYLRYANEANYLSRKYHALLDLSKDRDSQHAIFELFQADLDHAFSALNEEVIRRSATR
jgi:hypothetical protein